MTFTIYNIYNDNYDHGAIFETLADAQRQTPWICDSSYDAMDFRIAESAPDGSHVETHGFGF